MPANRRTRRVLVDECHRKGIRFEARPRGNPLAQRKQKGWDRWGFTPVVRLTKERDAAFGDDAAHLEG